MPNNLGATLGKIVDVSAGVSIDEYGIGQALGGVANDFISFITTGGNANNLYNFINNPTFTHGILYMNSYGGYMNSLFYDSYPMIIKDK